MSISVWADVGGTFTDCFVTDDAGRRSTKVLSSAVVNARVAKAFGDGSFGLNQLPAEHVDNFWRTAAISIVQADGTCERVGTVQHQTGTTIRIDAGAANVGGVLAVGQSVQLGVGIEAPVLAARILLTVPLTQRLPKLDVRLGTTRGTNALLTRSGAKTALLVTRGFADVLRIGEQDRPDLFNLVIEKPPPLTETVVEVTQRSDHRGKVLIALDEVQLRRDLQRLHDEGIQSLAIALMHAHVDDTHERRVEQIARELGFRHVSRSSEVAPLIKLLSRAETTTLDAYLNPILADYIARVWQQFGGPPTCRFRLMTSNGNLVDSGAFRGRDSILSGPAGGVVALAQVARRCAATRAIGLDMGGTSTDVSRFEGVVGRVQESRVAGVRIMTPMMDIETVAAGGGSICDYRDGRLTVGPASAGADPGPACYGRGGPLTVTDVNLLLGRIPVDRFPFDLDRSAARRRISEIRDELDDPAFSSLQAIAEGFLEIAVTHIAEAVRTVSTAQGSDVREMALVGFGGASGQHLCRVADTLAMKRILDHPDSGMLSALGMGFADIGRVATRGVYRPLEQIQADEIRKIASELRREATDLLAGEVESDLFSSERFECDLRYLGTDASLTLDLSPTETIDTRFHDAHQTTFGYHRTERGIELVAVRCEATLKRTENIEPTARVVTTPVRQVVPDVGHVDRDTLQIGQRLDAPAMIVSNHSALIVEPGWRAEVIQDGVIELTSIASKHEVEDTGKIADPVLIEVVARRLQGIADAMGEVLRRTSLSVNIKERRDYSCAVFRGDGSLVANAPHVPVHLGAMGHTVRHLLEVYPRMAAGDAYLSNDPFSGGSHLPDVTLLTPVFCDPQASTGKPDFFVASRAHHAEIGGRTPGSMPPDASSLAEEGVLIRDFALVRSSVSHFDELRRLLSAGKYPSRSVEVNVADISAAQAAGVYGAAALRELSQTHDVPTIDGLMGKILELAGDSIGRWIESLDEQARSFADVLDDGTAIAVTIRRRGKRMQIAFDSAPVHPRGFNATPAIVTAAVLYVLRCVAGSHMPLCEGVLRDIDISIQPGLLDPPANEDPTKCAAVVAGNVETSQRIVDVLLGALGVAAASQGTMNNVIFGDQSFGYYETIGGGSGATEGRAGADAVHSHMTNTRITDPEVVESRLPIRLHRFAIRRGSGGAGRNRGGDGIIREFEFLKPLTLSLLTARRTTAPYGIAGGSAGASGRNTLITVDGETVLPPTTTLSVQTGHRLIIETPGGGGYGRPMDS